VKSPVYDNCFSTLKPESRQRILPSFCIRDSGENGFWRRICISEFPEGKGDGVKYGVLLGTLLYLASTTLSVGQNKRATTEQKAQPPITNSDEKRPSQPNTGSVHGPIDILSDTAGMDVHPYLDGMLKLIRTSWYNRIPGSARAPIMKKGHVTVEFQILKDGQITDVLYTDSSGDTALDKAAYNAVTDSSPLPSLPDDFGCKYLALQIHFYYNEAAVPLPSSGSSLVPCVTAKIRLVGAVGIAVSPASAQVVGGGKQQFSAVITGELDSGVNWKVSGTGCSGSTCGSISSEGLYTAPSTIPSPPLVMVTATLEAAPTEAATATVTVVKPPNVR